MPKKKVTLTDIANRVGVSQGLVSLALSDSDLVNENTRAEIILAALEMGYDLNKRKIRNTREKIFSLVVSDMSYVNTFFWTEVIVSMENTLAKEKIGLDLVVYNEQMGTDRLLLELVDKKTSGLITIASCTRKRAGILAQSGLPMVVVDGDFYCGTECDSISASNYFSSYSTARYLIGKGHRRLAFVGSISMAVSFQQRRDGFSAGATSKKGVTFYDVSGDGGKDFPTFSKDQLLEIMKGENPPTAIFCANDFTAVAVFDLLKEMDLHVPEDVSLVGFDDIVLDHELIPMLTTNHVDRAEMGKMAVELLNDRIQHPEQPRRHLELCAPLIERNSVKKLN